MAQLLSQVAVGSIVKLNESGSPVDFYVAKHDYESSLNGAGRTLVVRKDCYDNRVWDAGNINAYASSDIDAWFNGTYKALFPQEIQTAMGTTKIRYTPGNGNNTVGTLERAVFALSATELGQFHTYANTEGSALPIASTLRFAYRNGIPIFQWTRSPYTDGTTGAWRLDSHGDVANNVCAASFWSRPAFTLPGASIYVDDNNNVITNQPPTAPGTLTVPDQANKGGSVAISWSASTDPDGNLSGYTLQRSVNGGGFTQVYQGASTSYTDTAPTNADTLQYRVQAYDTQGATSGWTTSDQFPVYGVPTLTVPPMVMQGQQAAISWSAIEGADSYTLQRKANTDADWTQVYSGANLSYTETVGTWTSLQYRVQGVFDGTPGGWATSGDIQIVSASALVISGSDGDLGILTNDVQYSISSDQTSPTIDVTVEVNGGEYASFQATSGQTYSVSVLDLPTGTGSVVITATTEVSSSPVTVTRTWTYSKTAPTFAEQGGLAQLTQQGANIWPKTIAEAVRAPGLWGGNLGLALGKLAGSVLYNRNQVAKYAEVTVSLAGKSEGDVIQLPENGRMLDFYVAKHDYESSLNGAGRTLVVRKDCYDNQFWDTGDVNAYASSDIDAWLNGTYKALLPQEIQTAMGTTKFYYTPGNGNNTVTTLERAVFALSLTELGKSDPNANIEGATVPIASTIQIAYKNGNPTDQWTRSPNTSGTAYAWKVQSNGSLVSGNGVYYTASYVPCFTLPTTFTETYYVDQSGRIHDSQEYEEAGTFTDISGGTIPMVSIETGSYVGTGTYGASNPNTLTFPFEPKAVFIVADIGDVSNSDSENATGTFYFFVRGAQNTGTFGPSQNTDFRWKIFTTWGANTISWYQTAGGVGGASGGKAQVQMNRSGITYYYIAIG